MMHVADTRDCAFEAFITNLGKYNEGFLVGASASGGAMRNGSSPTMTARTRLSARCSENTRV